MEIREKMSQIHDAIKSMNAEERAKNWYNLILELHSIEKDLTLSASVSEPPMFNYTDELNIKSLLDLAESFDDKIFDAKSKISKYTKAITQVVERLNEPIKAFEHYKEHCLYSAEIAQFYVKSHEEMEQKARDIALDCYNEFIDKELEEKDKKEFLNHKQGFVTVFLFQPPLKTSGEQWRRNVINHIFSKWEPNHFWYIFSNELKMHLGINK